MADVKISALTELVQNDVAGDTDFVVVVDSGSSSQTKRMTPETMIKGSGGMYADGSTPLSGALNANSNNIDNASIVSAVGHVASSAVVAGELVGGVNVSGSILTINSFETKDDINGAPNNLTIRSGTPTTAATEGPRIDLIAGDGNGNNGGTIGISAGNAQGNNTDGGDINLIPGLASGSGAPGVVSVGGSGIFSASFISSLSYTGSVDLAGSRLSNGKPLYISSSLETGATYTLTNANHGQQLFFSAAALVTVPHDLDVGMFCRIINYMSGTQFRFTGSGGTQFIYPEDVFKTASAQTPRGSGVEFNVAFSGEVLVNGDLEPSA